MVDFEREFFGNVRGDEAVPLHGLDEMEAELRDVSDLPPELMPRRLDEPRPGDFGFDDPPLKQP